MKTSTPSCSAFAAPDRGAPQPVLPDALLELAGGQVGVLQGHRGERDEAVGVPGAGLGEALVLQRDQLLGHVAGRLVPVGVDAERLDVDALLVHRLEAVLGTRHEQQRVVRGPPHECHRLGHGAVGVHVHRRHPASAHDDLAAPHAGPGRPGGGRGVAPDERDARGLRWLTC
jgi:hypothetical protein